MSRSGGAAVVALAIAGGIVVIGLACLAVAFVYLPTWSVFVGFQGFWLPLAVLMIGGGILSVINIPTGIRIRGRMYALNLLGFGAPPAIAWYVASQILPQLRWLYVPVWLACLALYSIFTSAREQGIVVPGLLINALSIALVAFFHYVVGLPIREVMWWAFTFQYSSLVIPDVVRGFAQAGEFRADARVVSIGGAGVKDALWTAPVSSLTYAFLAQWIFWGGHPPNVFAW